MATIRTLKNLTELADFIKQLNKRNYDALILNKVKFLSFGDGKCRAELKIEEEHANARGMLHGSLSSSLIDSISSFALMSRMPNIHVSVDINIRHVKEAAIGDEIVIEADTVKQGKTMAFLNVNIKNKKSGDLLVQGSHTKYIHPRKL